MLAGDLDRIGAEQLIGDRMGGSSGYECIGDSTAEDGDAGDGDAGDGDAENDDAEDVDKEEGCRGCSSSGDCDDCGGCDSDGA